MCSFVGVGRGRGRMGKYLSSGLEVFVMGVWT